MKDSDFREWHGPFYGIEVSCEGVIRRRIGEKVDIITQRIDEEGLLYVEIEGVRFLVQKIVLSTFFSEIMTWQKYAIHEDGNNSNCHVGNLIPVTPYSFNFINRIGEWRYSWGNFRISEQGDVMENGLTMPILHYTHCKKTDLVIPCKPYVKSNIWSDCTFDVERLVAEAWICSAERNLNPYDFGLLHIDGDCKNCSANNLKWVEKESKEYVDYIARRDAYLAPEKLRSH